MSQFNVGDRVVIRDWDDMASEFGIDDDFGSISCVCGFTIEMRYLCGMEFTIKSLDRLYEGCVEFEENNEWNFSTDMIRPVLYKELNTPSSDLLDSLIFA